MLNVYSRSLGCPKNMVDTERLLGSIGPITLVTSLEEADLVFLNTCSFIGTAVQETVQILVELIADLEDLKPRPPLVVAGCLVGRFGAEELAKELPEVDLWLTSADIPRWAELLLNCLGRPSAAAGRLLGAQSTYAWLKVSEGCRHNCAFCTIPSIRGDLLSFPASRLQQEARDILAQGVRELVLVAQDLTAWGKDTGQDLRQLLDLILPLPKLDRLRLMYLYPAGLTDDLLAYLAAAGKPFLPYFDIPLQHSHPEVLSRMGRPFANDPQKVLDRVHKYFPQAVLRTTMIVGFPGETEAHFKDLMDFVAKNRFHHLGVFAYQAEEGTTAALMPNQLPEEIKEERRAALMELQRGISEEIMEEYQGQNLEILVEEPHPEWPGLYTGRAWFQAPEFDGLCYISGPGVERGALLHADIVDSSPYDLTALA